MGQSGTFVLPVVEAEAAGYAFGYNPPYELKPGEGPEFQLIDPLIVPKTSLSAILSPNFGQAFIAQFRRFPRKALAIAKAETPPFVKHANVDEILGFNR